MQDAKPPPGGRFRPCTEDSARIGPDNALCPGIFPLIAGRFVKPCPALIDHILEKIMGKDPDRRIDELEKRMTRNVAELNKINQRTHDEIMKLDKRVKTQESRESKNVGDLNKVNQRTHDEIRQTQKQLKALNDRVTKAVQELNKINQRAHDEIIALGKTVRDLEKRISTK
ncbi:hypothetical protein [Actibacterium ureilyticum]|uniref:hypothetical protein n=1 Tax=Actibacterium ureilyticum TaxID=1590614 RepID=UPI001140C5A3|nr:hypothetical protein [Actibacterium ureilyticum]